MKPGQSGARPSYQWLSTALALVFGLAEGLLVIRIILRLLDAAPFSPLVTVIFPFTQPLIAPFGPFFAAPRPFGSVIEFSSLAALGATLALSCALAAALGVATSRRDRARDS